MNILFLTLLGNTKVSDRGIYNDLVRHFQKQGHNVCLITPWERKYKKETALIEEDGVSILGVKSLNVQKTNFIEKGLANMILPFLCELAIKRYIKDLKFDLILYSTPPITFTNLITKLKRRFNARTYLLLKDIFPQNAVDLQIFSKKSILYKNFRRTEKKLYKISDNIGCMSPANVEYLLRHNPYLDQKKVEINPNSIEISRNNSINKDEIRKRYGLPVKVPILIYGGNLGKPQGIDYIIKVMQSNMNRKDCFFLIVGNGTEYNKLDEWIDKYQPDNIKLMNGVSKSEYDVLIESCDIGLIFLDHRFTIPNYPSRLLSYLENKMPVLAATDKNSDVGKIAEENGYGYWCESLEPKDFNAILDKILSSDLHQMGENGYHYLKENYLVEQSYRLIVSHNLFESSKEKTMSC